MVEAGSSSASYMERVAERQIYLDFLMKDSPWMMLVTGLEGNGKSEFLFDIRDHTPRHDTCVILLNFAVDAFQKDALSVLEYLFSRIKSYCDAQSINTFEDILLTRRDKLSEYNMSIIQQHQVGDYGVSKDNSLDISVSDRMQADKRRQIRAVVETAFYNVLDSFRLSRLVILLDNCEWINEIENNLPECIEVSQWLMDQLIPEIHEHLQARNKRCSVVLASSVPPVLRNISERYQTLPCNLDRLDRASVDQYLEQMGVQDPEVSRYIYEDITHGHACCVWIVGKILKTSGLFTLADLPRLQSLFKEQALHQFLHNHIFEKYPRSPFRNLIHYGALLRSFDQPLLEAVFPEWMPPMEAFQRFHRLILYPYVVQKQQNRYVFVDLLREVLTHCIRLHETEKWSEYHHKALNFLTQIAHPDRFYHAVSHNEQAGMASWTKAIDEAYTKTPESIIALLDVINDKTLTLTLAATAERSYQQARFYAYNKQYEKALKEFEQARIVFHKVKDTSRETQVRQEIDRLYQNGLSDSSSTEAQP